MQVSYSRVNKANLNNVPLKDGQLIYVRDTHDIYMDQGGNRAKVSDIIFLGTTDERVNLENPLTEKLYFVLEESSMYHFDGSVWVALKEKAEDIEVDTTYMDFTGNTLQVILKEINDKLKALNTAIENNAEKIQTNTENIQTNTENIQINAENIQANSEKIQTNTTDIQSNAEKIQTNTENIQTNTENIQINAENIQSNMEDIAQAQEDIANLGTKVGEIGTMIDSINGETI